MRAQEVRRVLETGRKLRGRRVVLCLASGTGGFAAVAGRRLGGAVERNRARRILRAAWRQVGSRVGEDVDAVVVARTEIRGATTRDLVTEMTELLER